MVRTKVILIAAIAVLAVGSSGIWVLISEMQASQERRAKFFGTSKTFPTSGGQKMKPEW